MRLADFIAANVEPILADWETFARGVWPPAAQADPAELRDHAEDILRAVARDMRSEQSAGQQSAKSKGHGEAGAASDRLDHASDDHAIGRVTSGLKLDEVVAEYRALRASVVRLWRESVPKANPADLDDLTRFHESIDQSLTKAVRSYTAAVDRSRKMFLAILGHDLRTPLSAIMLSAKLLSKTVPPSTSADDAAADVAEWTSQIAASASGMAELIANVEDFATSSLGGTIPLRRAATDLAAVCRAAIAEACAAFPSCKVKFSPGDDAGLTGHWDPARLRQVISNLLGNAMQHGDTGCVIDVTAGRAPAATAPDRDVVTLAVHNAGAPIPPEVLPNLFDPFVRVGGKLLRQRRAGSVGLGLYIARAIVIAHGGTIDVTSTAEAGTTFTVRLPRRPRPAAV